MRSENKNFLKCLSIVASGNITKTVPSFRITDERYGHYDYINGKRRIPVKTGFGVWPDKERMIGRDTAR